MKSKNLIYICIGAILIIVIVGLIYINLDNESNLIENTSKINNTTSINDGDVNSSVGNNTDNFTNNINQVKDIKGSNNPERKNEPKNIPKKSRLSYSEALSIAKTFNGCAPGDNPIETYKKYNGYVKKKGNLYWKFGIYAKKNNEFLGEIYIDDATGEIDLG